MIKLTNETIEKAVKRAKQLKPRVRYIDDRVFAVESKNNSNVYTVRFDVKDGEKFGECDCKAGRQGRFACYHIASAASANFYRQSIKRQMIAA